MPLPKIFTTFTPTKPHVLRYVPRKECEISANGNSRLLALFGYLALNSSASNFLSSLPLCPRCHLLSPRSYVPRWPNCRGLQNECGGPILRSTAFTSLTPTSHRLRSSLPCRHGSRPCPLAATVLLLGLTCHVGRTAEVSRSGVKDPPWAFRHSDPISGPPSPQVERVACFAPSPVVPMYLFLASS